MVQRFQEKSNETVSRKIVQCLESKRFPTILFSMQMKYITNLKYHSNFSLKPILQQFLFNLQSSGGAYRKFNHSKSSAQLYKASIFMLLMFSRDVINIFASQN